MRRRDVIALIGAAMTFAPRARAQQNRAVGRPDKPTEASANRRVVAGRGPRGQDRRVSPRTAGPRIYRRREHRHRIALCGGKTRASSDSSRRTGRIERRCDRGSDHPGSAPGEGRDQHHPDRHDQWRPDRNRARVQFGAPRWERHGPHILLSRSRREAIGSVEGVGSCADARWYRLGRAGSSQGHRVRGSIRCRRRLRFRS
jgi:hypothetical protein